MTDLLAHPAFQSAVIPFVVALCVAAALGFSSPVTARYAGLAVVAGFLAGYLATFGLPPLVAKTSGQKIAYIAIFAAFAGVIPARRLATGIGLVLVSTLWIGWPKIIATPGLDHLSALLILSGAAIALIGTERQGGEGETSDSSVSLLVVCLGMTGIAFIGASASIAQNAGALSAALGGLLILNWPQRRFGLGFTARLVPLVVLAALAAQIVFFTNAPAWTLALLLPAFFSGRLVLTDRPFKRPVMIAFFAAVPTVAALAAAWFAASSDLSGGY
jgi:hypothetical protein